MPNIKDTHDPFNGYNFWVEWDGIVHAGFRECTGLDGARAATAYREGTDKQLSSRQIAGLNTYGNITLKRGITDNDELWKWQKEPCAGTWKNAGQCTGWHQNLMPLQERWPLKPSNWSMKA
jgi:phage tail-like protein